MSEQHHHHVSSARFLWLIAGALFLLTGLTVLVAQFHIPAPFNIIVALGIAVFKATLVAAFFMNLYHDTKFNTMLLIAGLLFFILMFGITLLDTLFRNDVVPSF